MRRLDGLAGTAMGVLLGLLIGLSRSPVVGTVVGIITAAIVTFLGMQAPTQPSQIPSEVALLERTGSARLLRVIGFGFAGSVALLGGLYARAHDLFAVPLKSQVSNWIEAGVRDTSIAAAYVAFEQLGVVRPAVLGESTKVTPQQGVTYLLSGESYHRCADLNPAAIKSDSDLVRSYEALDDEWKPIGIAVNVTPPGDWRRLLSAIWKLHCSR